MKAPAGLVGALFDRCAQTKKDPAESSEVLFLCDSVSGHAADSFQNQSGDQVRIAVRVGTPVFDVALLVLVHHPRNADRSASIGDTILELFV